MNQCASRHYKSDTQETLGFIIPLLKLGYKFTNFAKVITTKCRDWLGTPFAKYLRPKTLFRADNFVKYSNQHDQNSRGNWTCNQKVIQPRQNKFANFKQREWDFEKIEFLSQYDSASEEDLRRFEERRQTRKAMERPNVENTRQNKFQNFARRKWDFAKIKYLNQLRDDEPYTEEGLAEYRKYYEAQKAEREKREAENPRPTRFHNCEQRKWDFAEIRRLMYAAYEDDTEKSAQRSLREKQELISRVEGSLDFYKKAAIQRPDSLLAKDYQKYLEYTQEQGNEPSPKIEQETSNGI